MRRVNLWFECELPLRVLLKCFKLLLFFLFEDLGPLKEVVVAIVVLVTLRHDIIRSGVDLWMKGMVTFGFGLYLLLLMLHLQLLLKLPFLLMLEELSNISLLACAIYLGLECGLILVRVLSERLLINLRLLQRVLDLLVADYLFVPLVYGHMPLLLPLDYLLGPPIDLRLLSEFLELLLGTKQLDPLLQLLPPRGIVEEPLHSRVEYGLCHTRGVETCGTTGEAVQTRRREVVIEGSIIMQERVGLGVMIHH